MVRQLVVLPSRGLSLEVDVHVGQEATRVCSGGSSANTTTSPRGRGDGLMLVVLHPWAWLGGCMDDHVVVALCRAALATGRFSHVVRYNMRGTGASGGTRSLHASVDAADFAELARQLLRQCAQPPAAEGSGGHEPPGTCGKLAEQRQQPGSQRGEQASSPGAPSAVQVPAATPRLVIAAYSYGTLVAARALPQLRPHVAAVAMVAMPLGTLCRLFLGAGGSWNDLAGPRSAGAGLPRLLCSGHLDQFASMRHLQSAVQQAQKAEERATTRAAAAAAIAACQSASAAAGGASTSAGLAAAVDRAATAPQAVPYAAPPSLELILWPGCDHFFFECVELRALEASGLLNGAAPAQGAGGGGRGGRADGGTSGSYSSSSVASFGNREAGGQPQPEQVQPWKALARFVVGWLLSRAEAEVDAQP